MNKPIYKYATVWGVLGGTALAFLYIKTLGKDKGLALTKTLLIGGAIGGGLGLGIDFSVSRKPKFLNEEYLKKKAQSIGTDTESEIDNYLFLLKKANLSDAENQKVYKVIDALLSAKKDNKWDAKADILSKRQILMSYGVTADDFRIFENIIFKNITDIISGAFKK